MQLEKKKFILRVWSLMPEQSEGNNHTSKINVFPVLHTIFFLLAGQKVDLFAPHGAIKSTLWPRQAVLAIMDKFETKFTILDFPVPKRRRTAQSE